ncbi:hypothetical protein APT26_23380 [Escherichia coli]|nr:hypothetical protein APT26_23380 [Escherichia coli]
MSLRFRSEPLHFYSPPFPDAREVPKAKHLTGKIFTQRIERVLAPLFSDRGCILS